MANRDHQHATPFDDRNETEQLPEELRQVAQRYAQLPVPQPTDEEINRLITRLQVLVSPDLSRLPVRPARQRRRIRPLLEVLVAVLMVGMLIGSFVLVLAWHSHRSPTPSASVMGRPVTLQELRMFDPMNGWATTFGGEQVLHTSRGVLQWQEVSPPRVAQSSSQGQLEATDFMDALRAWVIFSSHPANTKSDPHTQEPLFIERTSDGGHTWQETTIVRQSSAFAQQLTFLTPQVGWLLLSEGSALGSEGVEVLRTTDGGATWQTMTRTSNTTPNLPGSLPFAGVKSGISFISPTTGWITGMMGGLYQTRDGGITWYRQALPLPDTVPPATPAYLAATGPLFTFSGQEGIFPVELGLPDGRVIPELYLTTDGGQSWQALATLPLWSNGITFLNPRDGWIAGMKQDTLLFYRTTDGGQTWKLSSGIVLPGVAQVAELNLVSEGTTGWILGETNEGQSTLLLQTTDWGQTWKVVQPLFLPPPKK